MPIRPSGEIPQRRRIVASCIADAESAALFKPLFDDTVVKHNVAPGQLTLHVGSHRQMLGRRGQAYVRLGSACEKLVTSICFPEWPQ